MTTSLDLNDPIAVLLAVSAALDSAGITAAAYGGLALAVYGEPRETKDADLAVAGVGGADARAALGAAGLEALLIFEKVRFGGNLVTRLTLVGAESSGLNTADLVEPRSPRFAGAMMTRVIVGSLRGQRLPVVSPEDFVLLKVLSTRERDLEDAAAVLRSAELALSKPMMDEEIILLAGEIPDHDVAGRWQRIAVPI